MDIRSMSVSVEGPTIPTTDHETSMSTEPTSTQQLIGPMAPQKESASPKNSRSKVSRKDKVKTEPPSAYAVFVREHKAEVGKFNKLDMPQLNAHWKTLTTEEMAPYKDTAHKEKMLMIENGSYRVNRKKKNKTKEEKKKEQKEKRVQEKKVKHAEKEGAMCVIATLTNNNNTLTETNDTLTKENFEEKRKRESFQKIAMDCQKEANDWKDKFVVVKKKYEALKKLSIQE